MYIHGFFFYYWRSSVYPLTLCVYLYTYILNYIYIYIIHIYNIFVLSTTSPQSSRWGISTTISFREAGASRHHGDQNCEPLPLKTPRISHQYRTEEFKGGGHVCCHYINRLAPMNKLLVWYILTNVPVQETVILESSFLSQNLFYRVMTVKLLKNNLICIQRLISPFSTNLLINGPMVPLWVHVAPRP